MEIKFVDVKYKNIIENLNLEIKSNQIISVVGKNSSGKTSFLNLIYGLDIDFIGKIIVDGKVIDRNIKTKEINKIKKEIFYMNQDYQEQLFNVKSQGNKIIINKKISKYEENKVLENIDPMVVVEINILNKSNETIITFFNAQLLENQL